MVDGTLVDAVAAVVVNVELSCGWLCSLERMRHHKVKKRRRSEQVMCVVSSLAADEVFGI